MSLDIVQNRDGDVLEIVLSGRLDTNTSPDLEVVVKRELYGVKELVLDMAGLEYVSSAGLRVILLAQKTMLTQGTMVVRNPREETRNIFDMTGFLDILTVE